MELEKDQLLFVLKASVGFVALLGIAVAISLYTQWPHSFGTLGGGNQQTEITEEQQIQILADLEAAGSGGNSATERNVRANLNESGSAKVSDEERAEILKNLSQ